MNNTYSPSAKEIVRSWHLVDAQGQVLGRMSTDVARRLMGKHKKTYSPNIDSGDFVVVVNASQVKVTGRKEEQKIYWRHSGYPGGLKSTTLRVLRQTHPTKIIEEAVWNMLPKNRLRKDRMARLKVYADVKHPYKDKILKLRGLKPSDSSSVTPSELKSAVADTSLHPDRGFREGGLKH